PRRNGQRRKRITPGCSVNTGASGRSSKWKSQPGLAMRVNVSHAALIITLLAASNANARADSDLERVISRDFGPIASENGAGGAAIAVYAGGATSFFNYGLADRVEKRLITPDSLFNLASIRKVFEVTLLALAVIQGELSFDDPASDYVTELRQGA